MTQRRAVIVGAAETPFSRNSPKSAVQLMAEAIALAMDDAHLPQSSIDGMALCTMTVPDDSPFLAEHMGLELGWVVKCDQGGASAVSAVIRAKHAIEAGYVDTVVCVGGGNRDAALDHDATMPIGDYSRRNFVNPLGYGGPNSLFGLIQRRHMHEFGTTVEQLGKIAVNQRRNAQRNPNALLRDDMTLDDYINSRMIADPIRLLDCVMPCSGSACIVVTAEDKVPKGYPYRPVAIPRAAESINYQVRESLPDRLTTGMVSFAPKLFAGIDRSSLDFLQLYDDYPMAIVMQLEDLGFAEKGKGGALVERSDISPTGDLPINTGGGQLSCGQPRSTGGHLGVVEGVLQVQGRGGERQVPAADRGLVTGIGHLAYSTNLACTAAIILEGVES